MRKHLNLIQFSRALVPIFVILFHVKAFMIVHFHYNFLKMPDVIKSGGVYYFFALSGFMAYYLYHNKFGNRKMIKKFLYSRFIRIYPIYWIVTVSVLLVLFIFPSIGSEHDLGISNIFPSLLLIPHKTYPILGVAWSLVHTVFFYLVFTIVFFENKTITSILTIMWTLISFAFSIKILSSSHYFINYLFNSYNLIFLSGVVCAYIVTRFKMNIYVSWVLVVIGIIGFPLSWINAQYGFKGLDIEVTTTVASILLILGFSSIDLQREIKIPKLAQYLGDASFSIYLTHYYCISALSLFLITQTFAFIPRILIAMILIVSSIVCGCIVHSLLEKPINKKLKSNLKKDDKKTTYPVITELKEKLE